MNGGIETGVITHVYGGPGTGKTQLCHTLCAILPSQFTAIYIDTEGSFRPERIKAIAESRGLDHTNILEKILVAHALDCNTQESHIEAACSKINLESDSNNIRLLVVDSIIGHYRAELAGRSKLPDRIQRLNKSMHLLLKAARSKNVAVIVTNHQMRSSVNGSFDNRVVPLGGNVISYASTYSIHLDIHNIYNRRARLISGPYCPQSDTYFTIDERGFSDVD